MILLYILLQNGYYHHLIVNKNDPPFPLKPIREWPFTLDPFQRTSISCIERKESVLVSAHTSAGKTVVAEYAIAIALRDKQRVIYTSPIKVNISSLPFHISFPNRISGFEQPKVQRIV